MSRSNWLVGCVFSGALSLATAGQGLACAFHGYTPNPTLVDLLLITEQVVVARVTASSGRAYAPVATLLGPDVTEIPVEPSREIRRQLGGDPAKTVLLARDGSYGPWLELAVLDASYRAVIESVMQRHAKWYLGGDAARLKFFAKFANHPNPAIRRLALQELDRAPYADLKRVKLPPLPGVGDALRATGDDLVPIRVLLAGLSGDRSLSGIVATQLDTAVQTDVPYTGAFATALIELEGRSGVAHIVERYLTSPTLPDVARERLFEALALHHKTARSGTRRYIEREVAMLVRGKPELAEIAARQFGYREGSRLLR